MDDERRGLLLRVDGVDNKDSFIRMLIAEMMHIDNPKKFPRDDSPDRSWKVAEDIFKEYWAMTGKTSAKQT